MGTRLGRYDIIRTLARGALTDLLLGRASGMEGFQRHVAIKQLREEHATDPQCLESFVNEARLAAALHHHNIVQVVDIGEEAGKPFFAMEYVHGVDLRKLLGHLAKRNEQLPIQHVVSIIASAAAALHHAHEQRGPDGKPLGIVHRQVTPANLLVGYDGNVKIVDFGIAKAAIQRIDTGVGVLRGSAPYMSPEQCAGRTVDRRSDVFGLGIVLFELATVRRLFKGANEFLTMSAVVNAEVPRPSQYRRDIPAELEVVMLKALARDPLDRYQTAGDMAVALDKVARSIGVGASTTQLANYMKLQFGDQKEPWLEQVEVDPESTAVDFDGAASGLAPPPSEAVKSHAIPKTIAATKSSPIQRARTAIEEVSRPKRSSVPPGESLTEISHTPPAGMTAEATEVTATPQPAAPAKPGAKPPAAPAAFAKAAVAKSPVARTQRPSTPPPVDRSFSVSTAVDAPAAETGGAKRAETADVAVDDILAAEESSSDDSGASTLRDVPSTNGGRDTVSDQSKDDDEDASSDRPKTAVSSPPPPPESGVIEAQRPRVMHTDATAIVEPLHAVIARAQTHAGRRRSPLLWVGIGLATVAAIVGVIVLWPGADLEPTPAASPSAPATPRSSPEVAGKHEAPAEPARSAMDMTARDYDQARAATSSSDAGVAEVTTSKDAAVEVAAPAPADAAVAPEPDPVAVAEPEPEPDVTPEPVPTVADATPEKNTKPAVRPAPTTAKRTATKPKPKRTTPAKKKPATNKKSKPTWNPDDLFLGE